MKNKKLKKKNIYTQKKSMNLVSVDIIQRVRAFLLYILCHIKQYTTIPPTIIYGGYDDIPTQLPCYLNCTPRIDTNLIILLFFLGKFNEAVQIRVSELKLQVYLAYTMRL